MIFTASQFIAHLVGDYVIQSDKMASDKTKSSFWAGLHAFSYTLPFMFITSSFLSLFVICFTHFLIDRFRLARYVCWFKNVIGGCYYPWSECSTTGYHKSRPDWLAVWLLIICDNTLHLICNGLSLTYL